jgi:hypothetical protein
MTITPRKKGLFSIIYPPLPQLPHSRNLMQKLVSGLVTRPFTRRPLPPPPVVIRIDLKSLPVPAPYMPPAPVAPRPAIAKESPIAPPPSPAPLPLAPLPLVPIDQPFVEGTRYRLAAATAWPSRLDLYHPDPLSDTIYRHKSLIWNLLS